MVVRDSDISSQQRWEYFFSGRVQGVGFRYTVQNIAIQYNVHGYVRNLPDGRVKLVVEGSQAEANHFVDAVKARMGDYIKDVDSHILPATGEFDQFYIQH